MIAGNVLRDQQLVTEEEFLASAWSRDFLAPAEFGRILTGSVFADPGTRNIPVVVTCLRPLQPTLYRSTAARVSLRLRRSWPTGLITEQRSR